MDLTAAEESLSRLDLEQTELNNATALIDQQITSLMTDLQKLEAKRANMEQLLFRSEEEIASQKARVDGSKCQVENLEKDVIPSVENQIMSCKSQISLLREEMDTEPSMSLTEEEQTLLNQLKRIQTELDSDIEVHIQRLDEVSIERQRLLSLLNDNLIKRKAELQADSIPERLRCQQLPMPVSLVTAQSERQRKLDETELYIQEIAQDLKGIELKLTEARLVHETLRADLIVSKAELEKLKATDSESKRELETAQENDEKLMTKVLHPAVCLILSFIIRCPNQYFPRFTISAVDVFIQT